MSLFLLKREKSKCPAELYAENAHKRKECPLLHLDADPSKKYGIVSSEPVEDVEPQKSSRESHA